MPIASSDIKWKYSTKDGAAGNANAGTAAGSLGKYISTTEITGATLHNLFDAVSGQENLDSDVEYRCLFIHNAHATITMENTKIWIVTEVAGGASIALGVDTTAASAIGSASAQALEVSDEDTAPVGVTFTSPTVVGSAVVVGDIAPGECRAVWVRRTAANNAALENDGATLRVRCESL